MWKVKMDLPLSRRETARTRGLRNGDPSGRTLSDPLERCSKRRGEGLQRNSFVFRQSPEDKAPYPRAHGPPKEPAKRIRSWSNGSSNGPVLAYAGKVLSTYVGNLEVPSWFYQLYYGRTQDFRRKFSNLPIWARFKVTFIRLQYFRHCQGRGNRRELLALSFQDSGLISNPSLGFRFKNLPAAIRATCRFIESNLSPRPSF
jgi:hypothetical protein